MLRPVLRKCLDRGIPIVSNFGAANPRGAAARLQQVAASLALPPLRIAVIEGDDLLAALTPERLRSLMLAHSHDPPLQPTTEQAVGRRTA